MNFICKHCWVIPDMYWPEKTSSEYYKSHEAVCVLNLNDSDCEVRLTLYFQNQEPIILPLQICKAQRTNHIRMDEIVNEKGVPIVPRGIPYAALVECNKQAFVQYTRVDTTDPHTSLMTTIAYKLDL